MRELEQQGVLKYHFSFFQTQIMQYFVALLVFFFILEFCQCTVTVTALNPPTFSFEHLIHVLLRQTLSLNAPRHSDSFVVVIARTDFSKGSLGFLSRATEIRCMIIYDSK